MNEYKKVILKNDIVRGIHKLFSAGDKATIMNSVTMGENGKLFGYLIAGNSMGSIFVTPEEIEIIN